MCLDAACWRYIRGNDDGSVSVIQSATFNDATGNITSTKGGAYSTENYEEPKRNDVTILPELNNYTPTKILQDKKCMILFQSIIVFCSF